MHLGTGSSQNRTFATDPSNFTCLIWPKMGCFSLSMLRCPLDPPMLPQEVRYELVRLPWKSWSSAGENQRQGGAGALPRASPAMNPRAGQTRWDAPNLLLPEAAVAETPAPSTGTCASVFVTEAEHSPKHLLRQKAHFGAEREHSPSSPHNRLP